MDAKQRDLIECAIRKNPNFKGHEDLMEQFCSEVYKKSYLLLDAVSNIDSLKNYLNKVTETSIINVLKSNGRNLNKTNPAPVSVAKSVTKSVANFDNNVQKTRDIKKYTPEKQPNTTKQQNVTKQLSTIKPQGIPKVVATSAPVSLKESKTVLNPYSGLIDPLEFFPEKVPSMSLSKALLDTLCKLDAKEPSKKYLDIFKMRYIFKCSQETIAKDLKMSKSDLSKRFCDMVKHIRQEIM